MLQQVNTGISADKVIRFLSAQVLNPSPYAEQTIHNKDATQNIGRGEVQLYPCKIAVLDQGIRASHQYDSHDDMPESVEPPPGIATIEACHDLDA